MADRVDWKTFVQDGAYLETVAVRGSVNDVPEVVQEEVLAIEVRATKYLEPNFYSGPIKVYMAQNLGRVAALRAFGVIDQVEKAPPASN